uniref:Uncharacterized protein n=1 Tax=Oryzias latipes TaxID=8090 RepID=A0A3P9HID1_ORYLA
CCTCGSRRAAPWSACGRVRSGCSGRSPVWTRWWTFRFTAFRKLFPQRSQVNVLGVCSVAARVKPFPQSEHWKRFSPVCMRAWRRRFCSRLKRRPHTSQLCASSAPPRRRGPETP